MATWENTKQTDKELIDALEEALPDTRVGVDIVEGVLQKVWTNKGTNANLESLVEQLKTRFPRKF